MQEYGELRLSLIVATTGSHGRLWCACFSSKVEGGPFLSYLVRAHLLYLHLHLPPDEG